MDDDDRRQDSFHLNYSVEEAADALRISPRLVRSLISKGELRAHRIQRRVLLSHEALSRFIAERESAERRSD